LTEVSRVPNDLQANVYFNWRAPDSPPEFIRAFGPEAERWAARMFGHTPVVVADMSFSAQALEEATRWRRTGFVITAPMVDDGRAVIARRLAPLIVERARDQNELRTMFDALASNALVVGATIQKTLLAIDEPVEQTLRDLYRVGSATLVRSRRQAALLGSVFGRYRPGYLVRPGIDTDVPQPEARDDGDSVVIWAPHLDVAALSIYLFALADLKAPIVVIGSGEAGAHNVRWSSLANAPAELRRGALIVDTSLSDPASAVALAAWSLPIVAASSSGADEFVEGIRLYDAWNWRSIIAAVSAARGDSPAVALNDLRAVAQIGPAAAVATRRELCPLVTVIVPTYDRTELLARALDSVQAQSYPNIEIVVVNDGGPPVDDVVARYPRARCISNGENRGTLISCNIGIADAAGHYVGLLADDDIYYFDHVERLVNALERSCAHVAHSNTLTRFLQADSDGVERTIGNQVLFGNHLDMTEALWWGFLGYVLVRREVYAQIGAFDATNTVADYEMFVRLSRSFDFVHVDQVTSEWRYRTDRSTLTHNVGTAATMDGLVKTFGRYPSNGDSRIETGRTATLAFIRDHTESPYWEPPLRLLSHRSGS
jgi:glycosyltransferase involved in cell wall biosynthesis